MEKKRIIALGSILVGITLTSSVLSTVAWFNGSTHMSVGNISVTLRDKTIEASTDNENWKTTLTNEDLGNVNPFRPVTSMFSSSWLDEKAELPVFRRGFDVNFPTKDLYNGVEDTSEANEGFLRSTLYLRADTDCVVSLDPSTGLVKPNTAYNAEIAEKLLTKYPGLSKEQIEEELNNVVNSLRVSILVLDDENEHELDDYAYYIVDPRKNGDTYLGGILDLDYNGYYDHYSDKEIFFGEVDPSTVNKMVYDSPATSSTPKDSRSVFDANTEQGIRHFNLASSIENGLKVAKEDTLSLEEVNKIRIPLTSGVSKRIVLSFYQEGWDVDNTNMQMRSGFSLDLAFMLAPTDLG